MRDSDRQNVIGVLALDTTFPRIVGDGGNAASYPFRALVARVEGASVERAVFRDPVALAEPFVAAGRELAARGATAIVTTCGFLAPLQRELADALPVPVGASALLQCASVTAALGKGRRVGVLTIAASALTQRHLAAAHVPEGTPIGTVEGGHFADAILNDRARFDVDVARAEHVAAARALVDAHPQVGAIVLECANMPPYAAAIARETGRPVYSILTLARTLVETARPPSF